MYRLSVLVCLIFVLAACQGAAPAPTTVPTNTPEPTPTPIPSLTPRPVPPTPTPFPGSFTGKAKIGDYELEITCEGSGEPTIILENGLDYLSFPSPRFSDLTRTCIYPRLGMSGGLDGPRTTLDQVKDLHALLQQTGVPGPYILVGHSIAGYNLVLYTNQYPDEVVGLVCVECRYPAVLEIFLEKLKPEIAADPALAEHAFVKDIQPNPKTWENFYEHLDFLISDKQVMEVASLGERPFVVLLASDTRLKAEPRLDKAWNEAWVEADLRLSKLSTRSRVETVKWTTHVSILADSAVDAAVKEVYEQVKNGGS